MGSRGKDTLTIPLFREERVVLDDPEILPPAAVTDLIEEAEQTGQPLGIDFECDEQGKITIVGVALRDRAAAAWWHAVYRELLEKFPGRLVGYASISADRRMLGDPSIDRWEDSMIVHYLNHQELCSMPGKSSEDGIEAQESYGFMNLWTATALVATVASWKKCRGSSCAGPCPVHDPLAYCAMDAWAALTVFYSPIPRFIEPATRLRKYSELKKLSLIASMMEEKGVLVDWHYVDHISNVMEREKQSIGKRLPFNPRSPKAALSWLAAHNLRLPDVQIQTILDTLPADVEEVLSDPASTEPLRVLALLAKYKLMGKGLKAWFNPDVRGADGRIHPRVVVCGTSTGRLAMSRPNLQNVPRLRWGRMVRNAIIAPDGMKLIKIDFSQLELRVCLFLADGIELGSDAFQWLVDNSGGLFDRAASMTGKSPRDVAKSVSHASDYLEGFTLLDPAELSSSRIRALEREGAIEVHRDWTFSGKVVAFTGVNLARRLFGSSSTANRRKALEIQKAYFSAFPQLRTWQKKVLSGVESTGVVISPYGRFLDLSALDDVDKAKVAVAFLGQGVGADLVQSAMIRLYDAGQIVPVLQVHDELVIEAAEQDVDVTAKKVKEIAEARDHVLGLAVPSKTGISRRWTH